MSLKPSVFEPVPEQTAQVARAAFPKGNLYISIRDELGTLFEDADFTSLYPEARAAGFCAVATGIDYNYAVFGESLGPPSQ